MLNNNVTAYSNGVRYLFAPRSSPILMLNLVGFALIFPVLSLLPDLFSIFNRLGLTGTLLYLLPFSPFILLGVFLSIFPNRYRIHFYISTKENRIKVCKNRKVLVDYEINKMRKIHLQEIVYPFPGFKQIIIKLEKIDDSTELTLIKEDFLIFPFVISWKSFSKKLSEATNLPLKIENLIENQNGKIRNK